MRAWESLAKFRGDSSFGTWLHRIAVNTVLERHRTQMRQAAWISSKDDDILESVPAPGERSGTRHGSRSVHRGTSARGTHGVRTVRRGRPHPRRDRRDDRAGRRHQQSPSASRPPYVAGKVGSMNNVNDQKLQKAVEQLPRTSPPAATCGPASPRASAGNRAPCVPYGPTAWRPACSWLWAPAACGSASLRARPARLAPSRWQPEPERRLLRPARRLRREQRADRSETWRRPPAL